MKKLILVLFLFPLVSVAQKGIEFEHGTTWSQIVEKAKKENKYIFMDAFTTWCGPCKYMSAKIFTQPAVGDLFNEKFINVKVQLDTTAKDNDEVKSWYAEGHRIMQEYQVRYFPTFLFFDPNGKLVHRVIGSSEADAFITKAKSALDPNGQYYVLLDKYKGGDKSKESLYKLTMAAAEAYDEPIIKEASRAYLNTQKDFLTKENMEFIEKFTTSTMDPGFAILVKHEDKFNKLKGNTDASVKIVEIIKQEFVMPELMKAGKAKPDWQALTAKVKKQYPKQANEVISGAKVAYFQAHRDWDNFSVAVQQYMKSYGDKANVHQLNNFAWAVFENCKDMTCVKDALEWSKKSFKDNNDPTYIDTYANILYKLGQREEAVKWEEKALSLAPESEKTGYQETINKMKKGEKTWKD